MASPGTLLSRPAASRGDHESGSSRRRAPVRRRRSRPRRCLPRERVPHPAPASPTARAHRPARARPAPSAPPSAPRSAPDRTSARRSAPVRARVPAPGVSPGSASGSITCTVSAAPAVPAVEVVAPDATDAVVAHGRQVDRGRVVAVPLDRQPAATDAVVVDAGHGRRQVDRLGTTYTGCSESTYAVQRQRARVEVAAHPHRSRRRACGAHDLPSSAISPSGSPHLR